MSNLALDRIVRNKRKLTKIPAVQWEIGQVKTGRKGTGEITNSKRKKRRIRLQQSWQSKSQIQVGRYGHFKGQLRKC